MDKMVLVLGFFIFLVGSISLAQEEKEKSLDVSPQEDYIPTLWELLDAADQGDVDAQFNLGNMNFYGEGIPKNYAEAFKWYRLSADQGSVTAQYYLGFMYTNGYGVPKNYEEAARWYLLAADKGNVDAQFYLGDMYAYGEGVPENHIAAYMWFNLAAAQGDKGAPKAMKALGEKMTAAQISEAQRLSAEWLEEHQ